MSAVLCTYVSCVDASSLSTQTSVLCGVRCRDSELSSVECSCEVGGRERLSPITRGDMFIYGGIVVGKSVAGSVTLPSVLSVCDLSIEI